MRTFFLTILLTIINFVTFSQKKQYDLSFLLKQNKLTAYHRNVSLLQDNTSNGIKLDENSGEGIVWLNDVTFSYGTIEIDLHGQDVFQRSFIGIAFHAANDSTYDAVYFRPFNFHAVDPIRKIHAVQYISHPSYTWKKLRDEQNGVYEKGLVNPPDPSGWFRTRIEVSSEDILVFVDNDKVPSLSVTKLSSLKDGKIGIWVGDGSGGEFANLKIERK